MSHVELTGARGRHAVRRHRIGEAFRPRLAYSEALLLGIARIFDVAVIAIAATACFYLFVNGKEIAAPRIYPISTFVSVLLFLHVSPFFKHYRVPSLSRFDFKTIVLPWVITIVCLIVGLFLLKISDEVSRGWTALFFLVGLGALAATRLALVVGLRRLGRLGLFTRPICVLGAGPLAERFVERINAGASAFHRVVGVYDDRARRSPPALAKVNVFGNIDDLIAFARTNPILEIVVALPLSAESRLLEIVNRLSVIPADVRILTDFIGFHLPNGTISNIGGVPLINVLDRPIKEWPALGKRIEDYALTIVLGLLFLPVALLIALAIKLDSPGSVLFRQRRQGFNNRVFQMYKFRTMYVDKCDPTGDRLTMRNDPRITRVGRVLRKFSLDETPQLLNVLNGSMSLVGPRPHTPDARAGDARYDQLVVNYASRHRVKPGITGWAQVNGWRGETDTPEKIQNRVKFDLHYIENWSLSFDVEILVLTLFRGITGSHVF